MARLEIRRGRGTGKRRVLVVDDNRDIAVSSSRLLELQGHEVAVAFDGRQALEVAREFRPDVALLDVGLPHIDGYELARRLRGEYGPEVLLIIITAYARDNDRRRHTKPTSTTTSPSRSITRSSSICSA